LTLRFTPAMRGTDTAFLFPGQGSQSVGMGKELYDNSKAARSVFHEVDMALSRPLSKLLFEGSDETLRETVNAQPAIMAVSLASMRAMQDHLGSDYMPRPAVIAGHSLGEYTALAVAGVLDVGETAWLVQERGRLMQEACEQQSGSMAAIMGLDAMVLEDICRQTGTVISTVNTPDQIVIAGERRALANALDMASARGAKKAIPLRVAGAFHSPLMEPAQAGLIEAVETLNFKDPTVPIIANCTAKPLTKGDQVKEELIAGICNCVNWSQSVDYMMGSGVNRFIEVGPGRALSGMVKRIDRRADVKAVGDWDSILQLSRN
jgi:[acyl-carrier-protein] S-malonyltransferase